MNEKTEVVIVGGGVLGLTLAYHLIKNRKKVLILEKEGQIGLHASGKNAGMIRHLSHHPQLIEWTRESIALYPERIKELCFRKTGSLISGVKLTSDHRGIFENRNYLLPSLAGYISTEAIYSAEDGIIEPKEFLDILFNSLDKDWFRIEFNQKVLSAEQINDDWLITTEANQTFQTEIIVNCAGAWFDQILPQRNNLDKRVYARSIHRTQNLLSQLKNLENIGFYWDEENKWYLRAYDSGINLFSACERHLVKDFENYTPSEETKEQGIAKFNSLFNDRKLFSDQRSDYTLNNSWYCFRTFVKDELPIIGEDPELKGIFYLTAFGGFGMSTSFAAASDVAKILSGNKVNAEKYFSIKRFLS